MLQCIRSVRIIFAIITVICLIIAVSSPWYTIVETIDSDVGGGVKIMVFYWRGVNFVIDPDHGDSSNDWTDWSDVEDQFGSKKPYSVYMASMSFTILALIATFGIIILILFGLIIHSTRHIFENVCHHFLKWIVVVCIVISILFIIISWAVFISFPKALDDTILCPTEDDFCSTFIGSKSDGDLTVVWTGTVGWIFAVIATFPAIVSLVLAVLVKKWDNYDHI